MDKGRDLLGIGQLEAELMAVIWGFGHAVTVRDVYEKMRSRHEDRPHAYTTIMTVMNNLTKKHLLSQDRAGHAFLYEPTVDQIDYTAERIGRLRVLVNGNDKLWRLAMKEAS